MGLGLLLLAVDTAAQHAPIPGSPEAARPQAPAPSPDPRVPFRARFGIDAAKALVGVDDERAIERLGALGTEAALQELAKLAENPAHLDDRALLLLVRALAKHAREPQGVRALYAIVARAGNEGGSLRAGKLVDMAREQAALALARGAHREGLGLLARMVKRGHEEGAMAARALLAHPPTDLAPVLESPGLPNVTYAELLEGLGDQRAFVPLREMVRRGSPDVQARAALALTRLGHLETVELAHHWLAKAKRPEQRLAATEILLQTQGAAAPKAWAALYAADAEAALELAFAYPLASLAGALEKAYQKSADARLLTLLGLTGSDAAAAFLVKQLEHAHGATAAYALCRSPAAAGSSELEAATSAQATEVRRLATVALALRKHWLGGGPEPALDVFSALVHSQRREDLWAGVWGRSLLDAGYARAQLESPSLTVLAAAIATAGAQPKEFGERALELLLQEKDERRRELLGVAVLSSGSRAELPSTELSLWIDEASPLSSLAVRALAERADPRFETKVQTLLASPSVALRVATAWGLAQHPKPVATGRLVDAYRFETEPEVRLAIVSALSHRESAPARDALLDGASALDVDPRVRTAARLALAGQRLSLSTAGSEIGWVELPSGEVPAWLLVSASGVPATPVPTAGQRVLPLVGVRGSDVRVRLASPTQAEDDGKSDAQQAQAPRAKR